MPNETIALILAMVALFLCGVSLGTAITGFIFLFVDSKHLPKKSGDSAPEVKAR